MAIGAGKGKSAEVAGMDSIAGMETVEETVGRVETIETVLAVARAGTQGGCAVTNKFVSCKGSACADCQTLPVPCVSPPAGASELVHWKTGCLPPQR